MLGPVQGPQHGEQVGGRLEQVALRAQVQPGRPAAHEGSGPKDSSASSAAASWAPSRTGQPGA